MKNKRLTAVLLTLCMLFALLPMAALAAEAAPLPDPEAFNGDIYVYGGQYTIWDGAYEDWSQSEDWYTVDEANPISSGGQAINRNLYLIDSTSLYFDDLNLGTGGLYSHADNDGDYTDLEVGILRAKEIEVIYDLWIGKDCSVYVKEDVVSGEEVYSYGCILDVGGDVIAPQVWFDSDSGPLYVTVGGSIYTYYYCHEGGSVNVNGNINVGFFATDYYPTKEEWEGVSDYDCCIDIGDYYTDYNFTELHVGGNMTSPSLYTYQEYDRPILVNVGGNIEVKDEIEIDGGIVKAGGAIRTTDSMTPKTIYIYRGKVEANEIVSATAIYIGDSYDNFGTNDEIVVNVTGNLTAAYLIEIYGGAIDVGGSIETISTNYSDTIYIHGGNISSGGISSATGIFIGYSYNLYSDNTDNFLVNGYSASDLLVTVEGAITAEKWIEIADGIVFADSISCSSNDFFIDDYATLFNAVNNNEAVPPFNDSEIQLYRTTLSGLIPNGMAEITIAVPEMYPEGEIYSVGYYKTFTAVADENGEVFVWLPGSAALEGIATYYYETDINPQDYVVAGVLYAEESVEPDDVVTEMTFAPDAESGLYLAEIGITVEDTVFSDGWAENPFDPANWVFTDVSEVPMVPEGEIAGFSIYSIDYDTRFYRNGVPYSFNYFNETEPFIAGDYVVTVTTVQDISVGEVTRTYLAAGSDRFTVSPAIITVQAEDRTATVGEEVPEFTLRVSDNTERSFFAEWYEEELQGLFMASCNTTTESAGRFPIYVLTEYDHDEYNDYALVFIEQFYEGYFVRDSIQFNMINGTFTVTAPYEEYPLVSYSITASSGEGGAISPTGVQYAVINSSKTYTITPEAGYKISDVLVDGVSVGAVNTYTFSSVTANHTIEAKFEHDCPSGKFTDVDTSQWYHEGIDFVLLNGLFNGTSETTFEPNADMTRAMLVTVLWRLEDQPGYTAARMFTDVLSGTWYAQAVAWANEKGIVKGYDENTFGPDDSITREQMATILYRYAGFKGYDLSALNDLSAFTDAGDVSAWALTSVKWAVASGLIEGINETVLAPKGNASRAEAATIMMRFMENVAK